MNRRVLAHLYLLLFATMVSFAGTAAGQMIDAEPFTVTVIADQADLRCGWGSDGWYSVGTAPAGTILSGDGREGQWLRVRYPEALGFGVLVRLADVDMNTDSTTATTNRPTRPIHRNFNSPVEGSWMKLTGDPLPPGTQLRVNRGSTQRPRLSQPRARRGPGHRPRLRPSE